MAHNNEFDVIIVGGSYAGLSAAMALGRALRKVLIIDSGLPCNRQTPHSHNFITQDGVKPDVISKKAKDQVMQYNTVKFHPGVAVKVVKEEDGFIITTEAGEEFRGKKIIFASGVKDIMPEIKGFSECWGISVLHCPYCHGYEVKHEKTGILANGNDAIHYARLIRNWTNDLTIFTNGPATMTDEQKQVIAKHNIDVIDKEIAEIEHDKGYVKQIRFKDGSAFELKAIYVRPAIEQHCVIPEAMGCEFTEQGLIQVDMLQKTNIKGVFACGDSTIIMRSVANAVAGGSMAGAGVNNELLEEEFVYNL